MSRPPMLTILVGTAVLVRSVAVLLKSKQRPAPWEWSRVEAADSFRPAARQGHSAVEVGQHIYVFGGCVQAARCYNDMWVFDTEGLRWKQEPMAGEWPDPRAGHSATLVGTGIFIFGGANSKETFSGVFKYDIVKRHWTRAVPDGLNSQGPGRRTNHAAALDHSGRIYMFGGYGMGGTFLNDLWILGVSEAVPDAWKARDLLHVSWMKPFSTGIVPEPREGHTMTIVDRKLIVFGGYAASGKVLNDLHVYDLDASDWKVPEMACALPPPREGHSAARHGHELIVAGGCNIVDGQPICQSDVWSLDLKWMRWAVRSTDSLTWLPREGHTATFVRGRMFTFGGCLLGSECYNDMAALNTFTPCPSSCGGHGECVRTCDGRGQCAQDLFCRCLAPGFTGHDCLQPVTCLADCGPHGACGQDGQCQCDSGWAGPGCSKQLICPGTPACSGQGVCVANSTCHCLPGFTGPDCADSMALLQQHVAECPGGCCGRGNCMAGACQCDVGWYGIACAVNESVWQELQHRQLAMREELLQEARMKREQAQKSTELADNIVRASQQGHGADWAWAQPDVQAEVAQLRGDVQALIAAASVAEGQAASGGIDSLPEMLATCDGSRIMPPGGAPPMALSSAPVTEATQLRTLSGSLLDSPATPRSLAALQSPMDMHAPREFIHSVSNSIRRLCAEECHYHGVCKEGVCFCRPGYNGETCSTTFAQTMGLTQVVSIAAIVAMLTMFTYCTFSKS